MKKVILFALFCSFGVFTFANSVIASNHSSNTAEELLFVQDGANTSAAAAAMEFDEETCTIKTKTTITLPDGSKKVVIVENTINMSCKDLVTAAIKALM